MRAKTLRGRFADRRPKHAPERCAPKTAPCGADPSRTARSKTGDPVTKSVEFLFDFVSPTSYLAYMALPRIADRAGASVTWTPVLLGAIMQATGNRPPIGVAAKGRWMAADIARWAHHYGLAFRHNAAFPVSTLAVMRGAVAFEDDPVIRPYCDAMFNAMWVEDRDLSRDAEIDAVLGTLGIDPDIFHERIADPAIKDRLKANTDGAVARGVFGAPTFFVGDVMHFGQDRLWMVGEDLGIPPVEAFEIVLGGHGAAAAEG